jgi:MoxR-like ATPase
VPVAPVGDASFEALLQLPAQAPPGVSGPLSDSERRAAADAAPRVGLGREALEACAALRSWLATNGLAVSDRRWRHWIGLMRVAAATEGRQELDAIDLWLAPYVAAAKPEDAARIAAWFEAELLHAVAEEAPGLTRAVQAFEKQLEIEQAMPADDGGDDGAGKLALARAIRLDESGGEDGGPLRMVSARLEQKSRRRWSTVHVQARITQLDELIAQARRGQAEVEARATRLAERLAGRLWLPPSLAQRWLGALARTSSVLDALLARLAQVRDGFEALPVDDTLASIAPEPVAVEAG